MLSKYYLHLLPTSWGLAPQNYQQALVVEALLWRAEYRMMLVIWGEPKSTWFTIDKFSITDITYSCLSATPTAVAILCTLQLSERERKFWYKGANLHSRTVLYLRGLWSKKFSINEIKDFKELLKEMANNFSINQ